jgi:2-C-methyl-D-erythritol 4-phosphate cytidylyltransferase
MDSLLPSFSGHSDGEVWAVIPAAGMGIRLSASEDEPPKQFRELGGRPILARTLDLFDGLEAVRGVVVVLPAERFGRWREWVEAYGQVKIRHIVPGGDCRFDSVAAGLNACPPETGIVVIHDGARPLALPETISLSIETARTGRAAVAAVGIQDTVKRLVGGQVETLDRRSLFLIQTPQTFPFRDLLRAYESAGNEGRALTDDAQLFERLGWPIEFIEGHPENLKVTTAADLRLAETIIRRTDEGRTRS